jgi:methionine-S-sulfoxide reductase
MIGCAHNVKVEDRMMRENNMQYEVATLAGGCFWCMEAAFEELEGVHEVVSGYTGGESDNPSYTQVARGKTGHREAVQIRYDPDVISYQEILDIFWRQIDPTDDGGQFADRGHQYTTAVYYHDDEQKKLAEESKKKLADSSKFDKPVATEILPASKFYIAEAYHQNYYKKRTMQYRVYEKARDRYKKKVWGE